MGRHSVAASAKLPSRRFILSVAAGVAVIGLVASGVYLWVGGHLNPLLAAADQPACDEPEQILVIADTSIASSVAELAADFDADPKRCVTTEVRAQD